MQGKPKGKNKMGPNKMTRTINLREKVEVTGCPRIYINVEFDQSRNITGVALSEPSKFDNTAMGNLIVEINKAIEKIIKDINECKS